MAQSIEPNIADLANGWLKNYKLDLCTRQISQNPYPIRVLPS